MFQSTGTSGCDGPAMGHLAVGAINAVKESQRMQFSMNSDLGEHTFLNSAAESSAPRRVLFLRPACTAVKNCVLSPTSQGFPQKERNSRMCAKYFHFAQTLPR